MEHQHTILGALFIGLIVGAVAKLLMPGKDPGGCLLTILLGIAGAAFGTYLGHLLGFYSLDDRAGFIGSVIGAMLILFIYRLILGKKT